MRWWERRRLTEQPAHQPYTLNAEPLTAKPQGPSQQAPLATARALPLTAGLGSLGAGGEAALRCAVYAVRHAAAAAGWRTAAGWGGGCGWRGAGGCTRLAPVHWPWQRGVPSAAARPGGCCHCLQQRRQGETGYDDADDAARAARTATGRRGLCAGEPAAQRGETKDNRERRAGCAPAARCPLPAARCPLPSLEPAAWSHRHRRGCSGRRGLCSQVSPSALLRLQSHRPRLQP